MVDPAFTRHALRSQKKIEKMLRKREEELVLKKMSATDTPLQTMEKLKEKQKSTGSAFVVLGNKSKESQQQERCVLKSPQVFEGFTLLFSSIAVQHFCTRLMEQ